MLYGIIFFLGLVLIGGAAVVDESNWRERAQVGAGVLGAGAVLFGLVMSVASLFS